MVSNRGYITSASGGDIVLLGHRAINGGSIQTNGGSVALGGPAPSRYDLAMARSA